MNTLKKTVGYGSIRSKYLLLIILLGLIGVFYLMATQTAQKELRLRNGHVGTILGFQDQLSAVEKTLYKVGVDPTNYEEYMSQVDYDFVELEKYFNNEYGQSMFLVEMSKGSQNTKLDDSIKIKFETILKRHSKYIEEGYSNESIKEMTQTVDELIELNLELKIIAISHVKSVSRFAQGMHFAFLTIILFFLLVLCVLFDREIIKPLNAMSQKIKREVDQYHLEEVYFETNKNDEIGILKSHINKLNNRITLVNKLSMHLNKQDTFDEVLDFIFEHFQGHIPYDRIGVAILDNDNQVISTLEAKSNSDIVLGSNYSEHLSQSTLWHVIASKEPRIINDFENHLKLRPQSKSTKLLLKEGMQSSITLPLLIEEQCVGVVFFSSTEKNAYRYEHAEFLKTLTSGLAVSFERAILQNDLILAVIKGFARIVESKDLVTGNHIDRIKVYSKFIAEKLMDEGLFQDEIDQRYIKKLSTFSTLHDIGKVGISDEILNKRGKLTNEEYNKMKQHTVFGSQILHEMSKQIRNGDRDYFSMAFDVTRHHHEKYDGSGYPDQLMGESIPLSARIVAIADVFDALTTERPYKEAFNFEQSMGILLKDTGKHFDPVMIDCLLKYRLEFEETFKQVKEMDQFNNTIMYDEAVV